MRNASNILAVNVVIIIDALVVRVSDLIVLIRTMEGLRVVVLQGVRRNLRSNEVVRMVVVVITTLTSAVRVTTAACRLRLIERLMNGSLLRVRNLTAVSVRGIKFYVREANRLRLV